MILRKFTAEWEELFKVNNVGNVNSWGYEEKETENIQFQHRNRVEIIFLHSNLPVSEVFYLLQQVSRKIFDDYCDYKIKH